MDLVVITAPDDINDETDTVLAMFEGGLKRLHVRKPSWDDERLRNWIGCIPQKWYGDITLHGNEELVRLMNLGGLHMKSTTKEVEPDGFRLSRGFHSIQEMKECNGMLDYGFVSPVFDSISKSGYRSSFAASTLKKFLNDERPSFDVYALGGVTNKNIKKLNEMGFEGCGVLGAIWQKETIEDRLDVFRKIKKACQVVC